MKRVCVPAWRFTKMSANCPVAESTRVISGVASRLLRFATISSDPNLLVNRGMAYLNPPAVWASAGEAAARNAMHATRVLKSPKRNLSINLSHVSERARRCQENVRNRSAISSVPAVYTLLDLVPCGVKGPKGCCWRLGFSLSRRDSLFTRHPIPWTSGFTTTAPLGCLMGRGRFTG